MSGEGSALDELVDADDELSPRSIASSRARIALDELRLHVAHLDRRDRAADLLDGGELFACLPLQLLDLAAISFEPSKMSPYSSRSVS